MSIDTYKLTSMEEPTDEVLSQLMREAAQDAQKANEKNSGRLLQPFRLCNKLLIVLYLS